MFLFLTAIDQQGQWRDFSCRLTSLELAFDVVSLLAARGNTIIKAEVIHNNECTKLPVNAFDGTHFSAVIQQLESEWQLILSHPVQP